MTSAVAMPVQDFREYEDDSALSYLLSKGHVFRSVLPCNLSRCTKEDIKEYFQNTYDLYEAIFSGLIDANYFYKCPDRLRLPLIFYLAHPATLYVNKLLLAGLIKERINRDFETMFETGVDEMSWDDTENYRLGGSYKWPSFEEVMKYRQAVRKMVIKVIDTLPLSLPITKEHPWWSIFMGMEHERIHLETSSVLIRQLPVKYLKCLPNWKYGPPVADTPAGPNQFIQVEETEVTLGKPWDFPTYGWDNEYGTKTMKVPQFEATKYLITNGEFKEFIDDRGYHREELWTEEGWKWVQFRKVEHPIFWVCHKNCNSNCGGDLSNHSHCNLAPPPQNEQMVYRYRAMYDVLDMPWEWPVDVNYHEAKAYCRWKGPEYRLPTEAEHHCMRGDTPPDLNFENDPGCHGNRAANVNMQYGSSTPVNFYPPTSRGFYDVYGNVWELTEDHFNGLPGFKTHYLYDDFSTPCFDGRHNIIQGGSWISTGDESSRFARFAFRRHFFQHMGFRVVRSHPSHPLPVSLCDCSVFVQGSGVVDNPQTVLNAGSCFVPTANIQYEYDKEEVCQAVCFIEMGKRVNYGQPLVQYCHKLISNLQVATDRAMVAGCGPGYTALLLGKLFNEVLGMDFSGRLLDVALQFQMGLVAVCGDQKVELLLSNDSIATSNVTFKQLTWFPNELQGYDFILFDFLERLMEPKGWLLKLWECLNDNGLLVISTSDKWSVGRVEEYIGQWFKLIDEAVVCDKIVSAWKLK